MWVAHAVVYYAETEGVQGSGGSITVWYQLYKSDKLNNLSTDLSGSLVGGEVSINADRTVKAEAKIALSDHDAITPYSDYLAIFMNCEFDDDRASTRKQIGLFATRAAPGTFTIERGDAVYDGDDLTSILARSAFTDTYNVAASTNIVTAAETIIELDGLTRHAIPASTETATGAITFGIGTTHLDAVNSLMNQIGYYNVYMTRDGRIASKPIKSKQYTQPYKTITDADLVAPVATMPLDTTLANQIIVVKDNPNEAPLTAVATNDDINSPSSTVSIGETIARVVKQSDLKSQTEVDALAATLLANGRTYYQTARLTMMPDADALSHHQTVELSLTGEMAHLNGLWWVRTTRMGLTPASGATVLEVNRVTDSQLGKVI